ncbi:MAG: pyrimidine-nucleoside phosphorylase, partial [Spirochaetales bacterium]
ARIMVEIGKRAGRKIVALVTDMNQPLGNAIGNALEVKEAIEILQGDHKGDLKTLASALAAEMVFLAGLAKDKAEAEAKVAEVLASGKALERLGMMIKAQGGDARVIRDTSILPRAARLVPVPAESGGVIRSIDAEAIGTAAQLLGAGRLKKTDVIDPAVGIWMHKRLGDAVKKDEPLCTIHANSEENLDVIAGRVRKAVTVGEAGRAEGLYSGRKLIYNVIR